MNYEDKTALPAHIGFIMDGNGRWATNRGLPRNKGHEAGAAAMQRIVEYCYNIGIKHITFYGFSTENWSRPKTEVNAIMNIITTFLNRMIEKFNSGAGMYRRTKVNFIGDLSVFSSVQKSLMKTISDRSRTIRGDMTLNIAINYGGRAEIVNAVNAFINKNPGKTLSENDISGLIYTAGQPDPDLIIRTAGEMRLSNFLLWQSAYAELYSTQTYWPDFDEKDLDAAIENYLGRTRKFGNISEEK